MSVQESGYARCGGVPPQEARSHVRDHPQTPRRLGPPGPRRHPAARRRRVASASGSPRPPSPPRSTATIVDLDRELPADGRGHRSRSSPTRTPTPSTCCGTARAHVMARAVMRLFPGAQLAFGPTTRQRLLLRHRLARPRSPRTTSRASRRRCGRSSKPAEPFERFERPTAEGRPSCADLKQKLQGRAHRRRAEEVPDPQLLPPGRVHRPVPRAAHPARRQGRRVQAAEHRRRVLEERRQPQAAAAALRHRLLHPEGTRRLPDAARGGQEARPPRARQAAQAVHHQPAGRQRADPVDAEGGDRPRPAGDVHQGRAGASAATRRSTPRTSAGSSCTAPAATSRTTATPSSRRCTCNPVGQTVDTWLTLLAKRQLDRRSRRRRSSTCCESFTQGRRCRPASRTNTRVLVGPDRRSTLRGAVDRATARPSDDDGEAGRRCKNWLHGQEGYLLKPMNCPHHIQIYKAEPRSYRDLPVRLAEFGTVYRFEQSGELSGMTRVRGFTQDDAHLFCTPEQVAAELQRQHRPGAVRPEDPGPDRLPRAARLPRPGERQVRRQRRELWDEGRGDPDRGRRSRSGMNYSIGAGRGGVLRAEDRLRRHATASAASGSSAPCSSTTTCPSGSTWSTSAPTTSRTGR